MLLVPIADVHSNHLNYGHLHAGTDYGAPSIHHGFMNYTLHSRFGGPEYNTCSPMLNMSTSSISLPSRPWQVVKPIHQYHAQETSMPRRAPLPSGARNTLYSPALSACSTPHAVQEHNRKTPILFSLLNHTDQEIPNRRMSTVTNELSESPMEVCCSDAQRCCGSPATRRLVALHNPENTYYAASKVLDKIVNFTKNLVSFRSLSFDDQALLFHNCWVELFIVGMAQEKIKYEIVERDSISDGNNQSGKGHMRTTSSRQNSATVEEATKLECFIQRLTDLGLTTAEYAYFMGTLLFDPDVPGLREREVVASNQSEARQALTEYLRRDVSSPTAVEADRQQHLRSAQILLGLPALKSIKTEAIVNLFFLPDFKTINLQ